MDVFDVDAGFQIGLGDEPLNHEACELILLRGNIVLDAVLPEFDDRDGQGE